MIEQSQRIAQALPSIRVVASLLGDIENLLEEEKEEA